MTIGGQAGGRRQRPAAETQTTPGSGPPAGRASAGDMAGTDPQATVGADAATAVGTGEADSQPAAQEGPVDEAELRQEIERTREQLGETAERLAAKTDVKARARAKATELAGQMKSKTAQARTQAASRSAGTRQKVAAAGGGVKSQLQAKAAPVVEATPEPVRRAVAQGASAAQQRRVPIAVAAVTLIAGCLVFRWWRKR